MNGNKGCSWHLIGLDRSLVKHCDRAGGWSTSDVALCTGRKHHAATWEWRHLFGPFKMWQTEGSPNHLQGFYEQASTFQMFSLGFFPDRHEMMKWIQFLGNIPCGIPGFILQWYPRKKVAGGKTNRMFSLQTLSLQGFADRYIFVQTEVVSLRRLANMGVVVFYTDLQCLKVVF